MYKLKQIVNNLFLNTPMSNLKKMQKSRKDLQKHDTNDFEVIEIREKICEICL